MVASLAVVLLAGGAGVTVSRALGVRSLPELALTAYVVTFASLALVGVVLGLVGVLTPVSMLVATTLLGGVGVALALRRRPWPTFPSLGAPGRGLLEPTVIAMALVCGAVLLYTLALALLTPPAEGDALAYHLARAAFWLQSESMAPVEALRDSRIDQSPPAPAILAWLGLWIGGAHAASLLQWLATVALAVGVYGVARRVGSPRRAAALVGLAVPALPVVALQAPTGLTDTVLASLVVVAAYAALDARPTSSAVLAVAVAAAVATKLSAVFAFPVLVLLVLVAQRGRARVLHLAAIGVGTAVAGAWFLAQRRTTTGGGSIGGQPTQFVGSGGLTSIVARAERLLLETLELPGAVGKDGLIAVAVGGAMLAAAALSRRRRPGLAVSGALVMALALVVPVRGLLERAYRKTWALLGEDRISLLGFPRKGTDASALGSWYGVVGFVVVVVGLVVAVQAVRRRSYPRAVLAAAPVLVILTLAAVSDYSSFEGRFAMSGVALGLAAIAPLFERPTAGWWLVGATTVVATLTLVHAQERPSGLRLLEPATARSVWTRSDADAMGLTTGMPAVLRAVDRAVPADAHIAVWASPWPDAGPAPGVVVLFPYPFFGPGLDRHVSLARGVADAEADGAGWAVLPAWSLRPCTPGWSRETGPDDEWQLLRQTPGTGCG